MVSQQVRLLPPKPKPHAYTPRGYHRLWAHRSYAASLPLQIWLACVGAGAAQNSIRRWARDHRSHHRYTDTPEDPYSVRKGLLYSHMGWLLLNQDPKRLGRTDISDLNSDPVVVWQHKHYVSIALFTGFILPMIFCGLLWNDWWGGLVYAGILRILVVQQATFCVNSLAHWLGEQPFDDRNSPKDHVFTALLTLGEGYHNFHHEFPSDYRNAIEWHQYDPTKWSIWLCQKLGLASELKKFRQNEIEKGRVQQQQKALDKAQAGSTWPFSLERLPVVGWSEFRRRVGEGEKLVVVAGVVHDVSTFIDRHPGGRAMLRNVIGKDATASFEGGVYSREFITLFPLFLSRLEWDFEAVLLGYLLLFLWKLQGKAC